MLDGAVLVAHAAEWDVAFLEAELLRAGRPYRFKHWLDTLILSRRAFALPSHSLDSLSASLQIDRGRAHRAGDDVRVMQTLFERVIAVLAPTTVRDLWQVRVAEHRARDTIVKSCTDAVAGATPVLVTYRASRRAPEPLLMVLTEVRSDLDPPRVLGYQLPGRGRRELRTDRILRVEPSVSAASATPATPRRSRVTVRRSRPVAAASAVPAAPLPMHHPRLFAPHAARSRRMSK